MILFFSCCELSAQDHFLRVREGIENNETQAIHAFLDSCYRAHLNRDSCIYYRGIVYLREGKTREAKRQLSELKKDYNAFYMSGFLESLLRYSQEDYAGSVSALNEVISRDPLSYKAHYNRALISGLLEDYRAAIEDLDHCIELVPNSAQAYYSRAYWQEMAGEFAAALADYEKTLALQPRHYDAYLGLAHIYHQQKNNVKACEAIERAVEAGSQMAVDIRENYCR